MNFQSPGIQQQGETFELLLHQPRLPHESRQEDLSISASNSSSPKTSQWDYYTMNHETGRNATSKEQWAVPGPSRSNNIWSKSDGSRNNAYYRGDRESSFYSPSTAYTNTSNRDSPLWLDDRQGGPTTSFLNHSDDLLSSTMGQLSLRPQLDQQYYQGSGLLVSVPSMASGTSGSTVPGVVGASSGSTSGGMVRPGGNAPWTDRNSQYAGLHSRSNLQPIAPHFYPADVIPGTPDAPPGFSDSTSYGDRPPHSSARTDDDSVSYDSRGVDKKFRGCGNQRNNRKGRPDRRNNHKTNSNFRGGGRGRGRGRNRDENRREGVDRGSRSPTPSNTMMNDDLSSKGSSEAIRMLMTAPISSSTASISSSQDSGLAGSRLPLDHFVSDNDSQSQQYNGTTGNGRPILPAIDDIQPPSSSFDNGEDEGGFVDGEGNEVWGDGVGPHSPTSKKREWLLRMNRRLNDIAVGELDPSSIPVSAIMNAWAKTKSAQGASMVEMWLTRIQEEADAGNSRVVPTTKMFTMAVDAWAKSGEGISAAQRAESILQNMHDLYQRTGQEHLRPTTGIFNAVINSWARSKEKVAPSRAEQILQWMDNLHRSNPAIQIRPDKFTYNTVIHAYAKSGGPTGAAKAQELLANMHEMHQGGNHYAKPDTITYNVVINAWAKSGGRTAAEEAEGLLSRMHDWHAAGDPDIKPNVITYGAVIDSYAKSGEKGAAAKADTLLAKMIQLHQSHPIDNADLRPNTYVFNTVINCWAKSKEQDAASKAEEMLLAMSKLHASGMPNLKPDAFTYTAVIDAWSKSGYRGAAARADQLLDKMEAKYLAGDMSLRPNSFTYNAVINALAKSGEPGAAARAERVLQNMVNRHRHGASDDCKPTTINFNTILDAWAKSGGGRQAAERAEEILEWMDRLHQGGNTECQPDTISFNAVIDAWARSGDRMAPHRAEQILDHMDELYRAGDNGKKPDVYSYNTLINAWAKSNERGSASRAEHVLRVMKQRYADGDQDFKPNTRTMTSVIDAWAKSGEKGAAKRAEQILDKMISSYETAADFDTKPNVHTANAVCNACAFTKVDEDRAEALHIAFRVFDWLSSQRDMEPDAYTYTILLSVCANLLPREDSRSRLVHAKTLFEQCCNGGYVNEYVLRKLRQTVSTDDYMALTGTHGETTNGNLPPAWSRNIGRFSRIQANRGRKKAGSWSQKRRGK